MKVKTKTSFSSEGVFPYRWAFTLLIPLRNLILSPGKLMQQMALTSEMTVLEVGPGPGYFSVPVARFLEKGKLVLADIQPEMLEKAKKRIKKRGIKNVEYQVCDGEKFDLPNNHFDRIFLVTVLGEVENKEQYLFEFFRMLKPGGWLCIAEQAGDPDKMKIAEIRKLAEETGFTFNHVFGKEKNFTINFVK